MPAAYHVIFGSYGFWLPNDPRGTWSEFVGSWELYRQGPPSPGSSRIELNDDVKHKLHQLKTSLKFPPVRFSGLQAKSIGTGFGTAAKTSNINILRCSILPEHVHMVIAHHRIKIRYIVGLLKGEATKQLLCDKLHPLSGQLDSLGNIPTPWSSKCWVVYLDSDEDILSAIRYVDANPIKEGMPRQLWRFECPYHLRDFS